MPNELPAAFSRCASSRNRRGTSGTTGKMLKPAFGGRLCCRLSASSATRHTIPQSSQATVTMARSVHIDAIRPYNGRRSVAANAPRRGTLYQRQTFNATWARPQQRLVMRCPLCRYHSVILPSSVHRGVWLQAAIGEERRRRALGEDLASVAQVRQLVAKADAIRAAPWRL